MEKNTKKLNRTLPGRFRRLVPALYLTALLVMAAVVFFCMALKTPSRPDRFGLEGYSPMDSNWYTEDGRTFEIAEIDSLRADGLDTVKIFHALPDVILKDQSIVFRSKNSIVSVLVGGVPAYESDLAQAPFYNHSPGTRWNIVTVRESDAGKTVELQVKQAYQDGRAKVDNFYFGDRAAIVLHLVGAKLWGIVISLLIFFVALVYLFAWVVLNWRRTPKNHSLLWLACFAMVVACWSLLETNVFQLFVQDLRLIQLMDNMMLVVGGLPLYLYMDSVYHAFDYKIVRFLCGLDLAYILLATASQLMGLWDYHQTLNGAVATYGLAAVVLLVCLVRQRRTMSEFSSKSDRLFSTFQQIGIFFLGAGLLGDLIRYLMVDVLDRAFIIRIGLLCFIICFGAGNIYQMILLVKKGMEAEIISQLAYCDGLTKAGNRTAYLEKLERLVSDSPGDGLALVMFDINNLKRVNDTYGHKAGDELLLTCSEILTNSFCSPWSLFRIGGDEFVALTHTGDVRAAYDLAASRFASAVARANLVEDRTIPIAIAHGVAFCPGITQENIDVAEKEADLKMYKNKYQLKCAES